MSVALAWLLQRSPNILLIPGTSSVEHLRENGASGMSDIEGKAAREAASEDGRRASFNVRGAGLQLHHEAIKELNAIAG